MNSFLYFKIYNCVIIVFQCLDRFWMFRPIWIHLVVKASFISNAFTSFNIVVDMLAIVVLLIAADLSVVYLILHSVIFIHLVLLNLQNYCKK